MKRLCKTVDTDFEKIKYNAQQSFKNYDDSMGQVQLEEIKNKFSSQIDSFDLSETFDLLEELNECRIKYEEKRSELIGYIEKLDFKESEDDE